MPIAGLLDVQAAGFDAQALETQEEEHRRFAADHGLDLDHILARCRADPHYAGLDPGVQRRMLAKALSDAAAARERLGGAA